MCPSLKNNRDIDFMNNTNMVIHTQTHTHTYAHTQPDYFCDAHVCGPQNMLLSDYGFCICEAQKRHRRCLLFEQPNTLFNTHTHVYCTRSMQRAEGLGGRRKQRCSKDTADIWAVLSGIYWTVYTLVTVLRNLIYSWIISCLGLF